MQTESLVSTTNIQCNKNASIEFLRFLFAMGICYIHLMGIIKDFAKFSYELSQIAFCVEMFFIMAGYFLFFSNKSLKDFVINRIFRLWPLLAFSTGVAGILRTFHISPISLSIKDIWNLLFLQGTGLFQDCATNGPAWFVGVLFWVSIMYFILKKFLNKKLFFLITVLIVMVSLALLWIPSGDIIFNKVRGFSPIGGGWISVMLLRGISTVGIGCLLAVLQSSFISKYESFLNAKYTRLFLSFLEFIFFITLLLLLGGIANSMPLIKIYSLEILNFSILFILFINQKGYLSSNLLNHKIFNILGSYSYSIFIMQNVVFFILIYWFKRHGVIISITNICIFLSLFFIIGFISYYVVEIILKYVKNVKLKI